MSGVAKSLGSGLAEGVIGLAGLPGDLYHMGLRALGDNLTPESRFGSDSIKKSVEGYTGEFYKPQGIAEAVDLGEVSRAYWRIRCFHGAAASASRRAESRRPGG